MAPGYPNHGSYYGGCGDEEWAGNHSGNMAADSYTKPGGVRNTNSKIKKVDLDETLDLSLHPLRSFRENGRYAVGTYKKLLFKLCKIAKVPRYKKNRPFFILDPRLDDRAIYECNSDSKILRLQRLGDLRAFLMIWFLYLEARNDGFTCKIDEKITNTRFNIPGLRRAKCYCDKLLEGSEPQQVRSFDTRAFIETAEV